MDVREFMKNCEAHSLEELAPYEGKYVAWSADGKTIVAAATQLAHLYSELDRLGIIDYVVDLIPPSDGSFLGGAAII